jgi:periplasmic protein TonB
MNRRNLAIGALATVAAIAVVAVVGQITGTITIVPPRRPPPDPALTPLPVEMDPIEKPNTDDSKPAPKDPVAAPAQEDIPRPVPPVGSFTQPVEPPRPSNDFQDATVIPPGGNNIGGGIEIIDLSKLDKAPIARYQARPEYPYSLRQDGITGEALVEFIVDPSGDVRNPVSIRSNRPEFGDAACAAVGKWKFKPGWKNGRAVFTRMQVPIVFQLDAAR